MKKEINFSVVSGALILVWLLFSPVLGLVLLSYFNKYFNNPIMYILVTYLLLGVILYWFGKYLNTKLNTKGFYKKEITEKEIAEKIIKNKYGFWSLEIQSTEHANKIVNNTAWAFVTLGSIMVLISFILPSWGDSSIDGLLSVIFGALLVTKRKLWISIVVLLLGVDIMWGTILNKITSTNGGSNVFLAFVFLWSSIQAFLAIRYLKKQQTSIDSSVKIINKKQKIILVVLMWVAVVMLALEFLGLIIIYSSK